MAERLEDVAGQTVEQFGEGARGWGRGRQVQVGEGLGDVRGCKVFVGGWVGVSPAGEGLADLGFEGGDEVEVGELGPVGGQEDRVWRWDGG